MKNILITTGVFPPDIGGPASYGKLIAGKLAGEFAVSLITYSSKRKYPEDKELKFKVVRVWKGIPKGLRHLIFLLRTFRMAKNCDVIYSLNAISAGIPALICAKLRKKKFVVKIVGDYSWEIAVNAGKTSLLMDDFQSSKKYGKIKILNKLQAWVCKNSDVVIVPSEYLGKIVKGWGINENKIRVVYNEVEFEKSDLSKEDARNKIGIHGNIILSIGRLVPWKGFKMLIKIMPELLKINQFLRLVIIGEGPDKKALEAMIKNMSLDRKVYLVGKKSQEELAIFMAASDIFVLNTGYEGFSHQLLEAMVAGLPVITTSVGGNIELIHQGENGFMVKYNDEFNLVQAIKTIWQEADIRQHFIDGGKKTAGLFNAEIMYKETINALGLK
jgi:glycosyltransferase involved in cell wall biosynthesis